MAFLTLSALCVSKVAFANSYSDLPDTDKAYITRVCAPIQYQQDTATYRNCVEQHSEAMLTANRTPVSQLAFDEQLSVQQACQQYGAIGSTGYNQCVDVEVSSLEGTLAADISSLSNEKIYAARQSCTNTNGGVKAYRQCVNTAVDEMKTQTVAKVELPDIVSATQEIEPVTVEPVAIEPVTLEPVAIEPVTLESVAIEPAIVEFVAIEPAIVEFVAIEPATVEFAAIEPKTVESAAIEPVTVESVAIEPDFAASTSVTMNTTSVEIPATLSALRVETTTTETPVLAAAEPVTTNEQSAEPATQADSDPENTNEPPLEVAKDFAQKLWDQLLTSLEGVTGVNRIILLAALALPLVLLGFWLLMRRGSEKPESDLHEYSKYPDDRTNVGRHDSIDDDTVDVTSDNLSTQQINFDDQMGDLFAEDKQVSADAEDDESEFDEVDATIRITPVTEEPDDSIPSGSLGALLENHDSEDQLGLAIEFMIYWMAFTDERYNPELKSKIFAKEEPDDHDLIKRSVLSQDFGAFTEAVSWLQKNTTIEQREQILNLLMALLVYEEGITPVQNTTLRFLCNAFGLTHKQLDDLFQAGFGHALPSMPRPDKPTWWKKQPPDKLKRWDARSIAQQPPSIQARVKLGLPLSGDLDPQHITATHKRAISRCQADKFDLLTSREQQLAESQQAKYNNAADVLMEISE